MEKERFLELLGDGLLPYDGIASVVMNVEPDGREGRSTRSSLCRRSSGSPKAPGPSGASATHVSTSPPPSARYTWRALATRIALPCSLDRRGFALRSKTMSLTRRSNA